MARIKLQTLQRTQHATLQSDQTSVPRLTVCLVTALSLEDYTAPELTERGANQYMAGNMGVLTLTAVLREHGYAPHVVNLDALFLERVRSQQAQGAPSFFEYAVDKLGSQRFDVFGFSSISSSYPFTVRLAREVKRLHPGARIVLGGPQASVVDVATLEAFAEIDLVIRGEAEQTLPGVLERWQTGQPDWSEMPGIAYREGERVIRNPNAPVLADLDQLPLPAFDLDPDVKHRGSAYLELGRGCPFACTFCSTNDFFRRNFRLKSCARMLEDMQAVSAGYGLVNFSLIHDMYTVDRRKVVAFCEALLAADARFTWTCSARTDCIDDELIALMARAGCRGVFFGIETGSARLQQVVKKKIDLTEAWQRIRAADAHQVRIAVALITAFPDETRADLRDTIHFFIDALRFDHAEPQLSLLAPLAGTPIQAEHADRLVLDHIYSDMSHQGWAHDAAELELIERHPAIFPNFYSVPTRWIPRAYFKEVRDFVTYLSAWFRWLLLALRQETGDFLGVFDRFQQWRSEQLARTEEVPSNIPYHAQRRFRTDFLTFVRECYLPAMGDAGPAIEALLASEGGEISERSRPGPAFERSEAVTLGCVPVLAPDVRVVEIAVSYTALVDALRAGRSLASLPAQRSAIAFRPAARARTEVWQLSPLSAALLELCDGARSVREISQALARVAGDLDGVSPEATCAWGLRQLRQNGLVELSTQPVATQPTAADVPDAGVARRYAPPPQSSHTQQPWPWPVSGAAERG